MSYQKELEMEIRVDGSPLQGISTIFVKDGKVDYSLAEEHFYEIIRKWESEWLKEAEQEELESIIDNLSKEQEDKLQNAHAEDYHGTDDDMSDDYESWLMDLDLDTIKKIICNEKQRP